MGLTHITKRRDFKAAAEKGMRYRSAPFTVQVRLRNDMPDGLPQMPAALTETRLGLTASRHVGTATERNRIRRRLRAAAEQAYGAMADAALDIVIIARRDVLTTRFDRLKSELACALTRGRPAKTAVSSPSHVTSPATVRSRSPRPQGG
jgi:ribonuclease P protein component